MPQTSVADKTFFLCCLFTLLLLFNQNFVAYQTLKFKLYFWTNLYLHSVWNFYFDESLYVNQFQLNLSNNYSLSLLHSLLLLPRNRSTQDRHSNLMLYFVISIAMISAHTLKKVDVSGAKVQRNLNLNHENYFAFSNSLPNKSTVRDFTVLHSLQCCCIIWDRKTWREKRTNVTCWLTGCLTRHTVIVQLVYIYSRPDWLSKTHLISYSPEFIYLTGFSTNL